MLNWLYPLADDTTTWEFIWRAGGAAMYPLLLLAMAAIPVAGVLLGLHLTVGRKRGRRVFAILALGYGLLAIGVGALGTTSGRWTTHAAVASVAPEEKEELLAYGYAEAAVPQRFGILVGLPFLLLGAGLALLPPRKADAAPSPNGVTGG